MKSMSFSMCEKSTLVYIIYGMNHVGDPAFFSPALGAPSNKGPARGS